MALGATGTLVVRRFLAEGLTIVIVGLAVGLVGAIFATRILQSMICGYPQDPMTFAAVSTTLLTIASVASLIRRCARRGRIRHAQCAQSKGLRIGNATIIVVPSPSRLSARTVPP